MKAISLHQPFASLIATKRKTKETRTWPTNHRGDVLVVSTKKPEIPPDSHGSYPTGRALCVATIVNCRLMQPTDEIAACCMWEKGRYTWELKNIRPVEPFTIKGSRKFYEVDDDLIEMDCRNCMGMEGGCELDGLCLAKAG